MEENWKIRTEWLIGKNNIERLSKAKILVYGIGGVGSYVVEGLVRAGIENIIIVDNDKISFSNINRQIHSTVSSIGNLKVDEMKKRILSINPQAKVEAYIPQNLKEGEENLINKEINYVIDSVDIVTTKIKLIQKANEAGVPIISCMGTGNKLNPMEFEIADIYKTSVCPLARVMRKELKKRGINKLKVLYSKEKPININNDNKSPASISFVPSVAGMIIASEVIKDIIDMKEVYKE